MQRGAVPPKKSRALGAQRDWEANKFNVSVLEALIQKLDGPVRGGDPLEGGISGIKILLR